MTKPSLILATSALVGLAACAQPVVEEDIVTRIDADGDGYVTETEFMESGSAGDFDTFDTDADGYLSTEEYDAVGLSAQDEFDTFDSDTDGFLDEQEFGIAAYDSYDVDRDGLVDIDEADGIGPGIGDAGGLGL